MVHDQRTIRNVDDEIYRIAPKTYDRGAVGRDAREEYGRDLREKRYLHHQMNRMANGGAVPPMPMPMMPPPPMAGAPMGVPPEAQVQMTEQMASQEGEMLGREYLDEMMTGMDTADSTDELIDSIRGNDRTLQERYDELANFVGERDASATPESVLALVQPTIMLTEQGAMDSGIGELMQGIAGEVDMETEMGAPTPMGQGVGELMVTESVEEVIPEMNAGGPIQYFQKGTNPYSNPYGVQNLQVANLQGLEPLTIEDRFRESVETRLPLYRELLGDTDQTKQDIQSKLAFDVAMAGLNLASGTDPRTGESMAGGSLASQIATAAGPVAASAGQAAGELRRAEQIPALAALQSAEGVEAARVAAAYGERSQRVGIAGQAGLEQLRGETAKTLQESDQEFRDRIDLRSNELSRYLQSAEAKDAMERLVQNGIITTEQIDQEGLIRMDLLNDEQKQQLLMDERVTGRLRETLTANFELEDLRQSSQNQRLREQIEASANLQENQLGHELHIFNEELTNRKDEFSRNMTRLLENDEWSQAFAEIGLAEDRERRIATVGGEGSGWFADVPILSRILKFTERSAMDLNADELQLREMAFDLQREAHSLAEDEFQALQRSREAQQRLAELTSQQDFTSDMMEAMSSLQTDYNTIFGNNTRALMQGYLSDPSLLSAYQRGDLDDRSTNLVQTAITELMQERRQYDPVMGTWTTTTPQLPRHLEEALGGREAMSRRLGDSTNLNLGPPFTGRAQGGEIRKMANGGDAYSGVRDRLASTDPSMLEPIPTEGVIVDETINFERASGPPRVFQGPANFLGDTLRDVTGVGGPPFPEIDRAAEQLTAVANQTQRFIRDSVAGRPFAVEIEAMAQEIAKPGAFRMDEQNLIKLQTMLSQLTEIQGIAASILERPQGFDRKTIVSARQDLTQLGPLIDNYGSIIKSYEMSLGKTDKPDPSLFERG